MRLATVCVRRIRRTVLASAVLVSVAFAPARAQVTGEGLPPTARAVSVRPQLVEIEFEGNEEDELNDRVLLAQIRSKPTERPGLLTRVFGVFSAIYDANPLMPERQRDAVREVVDSLRGDTRFFNPRLLQEDTAALRNAYNSFGYHDAQFDYRVEVDTARNRSRIVFVIEEGRQYALEGIEYLGLEDVPADIRERVTEPMALDLGDEYKEAELVAQAARVAAELQNEGYAFAAPTNRLVLQVRDSATGRFYDSALVAIYTGNRYRIGSTTYLPDKESEGPPLRPETVLRQIEYTEGEWYSRREVNQTLANLYGLGVFEYVLLDSLADRSTDSILAMQLVTVLRDPRELSIAPELTLERRGSEDFEPFVGAAVAFSHANLFGGAERLSAQVRARTDFKFGRPTGGVTLSYLEPTFLGRRRLAFQAVGSADYAIEDQILGQEEGQEDASLRSLRFALAPEVTWRLPRHTIISSMTMRLRGQWLGYRNVRQYLDTLASVRLQQANSRRPEGESFCPAEYALPRVRRVVTEELYRDQVWLGDDSTLVTNEYVRENFDLLKYSLVGSFSATGDKRDDFFAPSSGYYADAMAELGTNGFGAANWAKLDLDGRVYFPASEDAVAAGRVHLGGIYPFGGVRLVPATSRFWAGGPNSIRGWGPRELVISGAIPQSSDSCAEDVIDSIRSESRQLVGGLAVMEVMTDYRWRPFKLPGVSLLQRQINKLIIIPSIDVGGAFFRDFSDLSETESAISFIIDNIAVSAALAIGYDTPIGPIRIGVGVPIVFPKSLVERGGARTLWGREFDMSYLAWYFAIAHAF